MKYILIILMFACCLACNKTDKDYMDYAKGGEIVYPGKADSLKAFPGKGRIRLSWLLKTDATIVKCRVYWNRRADSLEVDVQRSKEVDTIRVTLDHMAEGAYTFDVYTYNDRGNVSIKNSVNGNVYGDLYAGSLLNRLLKNALKTGGKTKLQWVQADAASPGVEVFFKDQAAAAHKVFVPSGDSVTLLEGYPLGDTLQYRTLFLPADNAIDTFAAPNVTVTVH